MNTNTCSDSGLQILSFPHQLVFFHCVLCSGCGSKGYMDTTALVSGTQATCWGPFSPSILWTLEIEPKLLGLVESAFTHWVFFLALALWYFDGNCEIVMKSSLKFILLDLCVPIGNLFARMCSLGASMKMYLHN